MFTVMTWNVQNLFPAGSADGPKTEADCDKRLDALAATIGTLAPDAAAFQEVGDPASLDDLLGRAGGTWDTAYRAIPTREGSVSPSPRGCPSPRWPRSPSSPPVYPRCRPTTPGRRPLHPAAGSSRSQ